MNIFTTQEIHLVAFVRYTYTSEITNRYQTWGEEPCDNHDLSLVTRIIVEETLDNLKLRCLPSPSPQCKQFPLFFFFVYSFLHGSLLLVSSQFRQIPSFNCVHHHGVGSFVVTDVSTKLAVLDAEIMPCAIASVAGYAVLPRLFEGGFLFHFRLFILSSNLLAIFTLLLKRLIASETLHGYKLRDFEGGTGTDGLVIMFSALFRRFRR